METFLKACSAKNVLSAASRMEDGDWSNAADYCNRVLDISPENAEAYVGLLMAELQVRRQEALKDCSKPFDTRNNYRRAFSFADNKYIGVLPVLVRSNALIYGLVYIVNISY